MGLYLGKKKLCSYDEKQITKNSMKMLFDSVASASYGYIYTFGHFPPLSNSNATSMDGWFLYDDTINVTTMNLWFQQCCLLTSAPEMNTSNVTRMYYMFYSCYLLVSIPLYDTEKVTNMAGMFSYCRSLVSIPAMNVSNATNFNSMFSGCSSLQEIHMYGMAKSFDISASTKFTESALVEILNNLASVSSAQTLTMGSTNLAKLTDEEKAIATGKGWTLK